MRSVCAAAALVAVSWMSAFGAAPVPRQSPEFVINYPGGQSGLLSSYKGKVVALLFIFTTCPHCQVTCQTLSKLYTELGPKGFQPLAVAVNPMALMLVPDFVRDYHINFPVGASERDPALSYLQINGSERWVVPQVVLIDRHGVIQAQTPPSGDENLQGEAGLRTHIENLLRPAASPASRRTAPTKKRPS